MSTLISPWVGVWQKCHWKQQDQAASRGTATSPGKEGWEDSIAYIHFLDIP